MKINGNNRVNTTADGLLRIDLKLARAMASMALY